MILYFSEDICKDIREEEEDVKIIAWSKRVLF